MDKGVAESLCPCPLNLFCSLVAQPKSILRLWFIVHIWVLLLQIVGGQKLYTILLLSQLLGLCFFHSIFMIISLHLVRRGGFVTGNQKLGVIQLNYSPGRHHPA